ncbi:hypothetical protein PV721_22790 [Streptomyces sp. MB09-01]|nr:hypothetical protein [Streptomyces sp. MB09-01]
MRRKGSTPGLRRTDAGRVVAGAGAGAGSPAPGPAAPAPGAAAARS